MPNHAVLAHYGKPPHCLPEIFHRVFPTTFTSQNEVRKSVIRAIQEDQQGDHPSHTTFFETICAPSVAEFIKQATDGDLDFSFVILVAWLIDKSILLLHKGSIGTGVVYGTFSREEPPLIIIYDHIIKSYFHSTSSRL